MLPPCLLLCAGLGTRLDPLTRLVAKAAVPLGGRALIEHIVSGLVVQGVTDLIVNLHHHPETITSILGDGAHLGARIRYSWEPAVLGSAGGPRRAFALVDADSLLVVNGDTLTDFPIAPMVASHRARHADVTLAVVPNPAPAQYNGLVVGALDRVAGFAPRGPAAEGTWHFVGVQIAERHVFDGLRDGDVADTIAGIYRPMVASGAPIVAWKPATPFVDVGTPLDYWGAATRMAPDLPGRTVVWPGARVEPSADLVDCVVAGPVLVPGGFRARRSIVMPAAVVRPGDAAEIRGDVAVFPIAGS